MRLALPYVPRRAGLTAFGLTMGLWAVLVIGAVSPLSPFVRLGIALLAGGCIAAAFHWRRREGEACYRLWVRASRLYAKITRRVLLVLCHAVISVVGVAGAPLVLARPGAGRSLWHPRATLPPAAYGSQFDGAGTPWLGHPWRAVLDWAIRARHGWVIFLLPFLVVVSILDTEQQDRYPQGIYTLF